ncbi:hypothetical protein TWF481_005348 [Arthrobotrys musiformis]|uniref:F-box domain-containing protein n=1 Tax=Arthrobotrys musiformis TaxID=47236 RepID=A0AAV9WFP5_9PEZI
MRLPFRKTLPNSPPTPPIFLIPELAEKILLEVPALQVLTTCRAVCKTWRDLIDTSSPDLKYYSTSGLKRPSTCTSNIVAGPSRPRQRPPPYLAPHPQLLTPIAVDVLTIFWKKLAEHGITMGRLRPSIREWVVNVISNRPGRSGGRRGSSSSSMNGFQECLFVAGFILIALPMSAVHKASSFIKKRYGTVGRKKRAVTKLGRKLIKQFTPVWQKVQIFRPHDPEFQGVLIDAGTNWTHDSIDAWDHSISLPKNFNRLSDAANALMTPLVEAIYSGKLLIIDPPSTDPAELATARIPSAGIDLTYKFDGPGPIINIISRYDGEPKESFLFEAYHPFNVTYKFTRLLEDERISWGVSANTLWRNDQPLYEEEPASTEDAS